MVRPGIRGLTREQADWLQRKVREHRDFYFRLRLRLGKWSIRDDPTYDAHVGAERVYHRLISLSEAVRHAGEFEELETDPDLWRGDGI